MSVVLVVVAVQQASATSSECDFFSQTLVEMAGTKRQKKIADLG
jgi:hypothetical protein